MQPQEATILKASSASALPGEPNCQTQVAYVHRLHNSEANYDKHHYELSMNMLRNHEGLGAPLKMGMELHAARQIGRLPFLQSRWGVFDTFIFCINADLNSHSSNIMEDVLLGRDEMIGFSDFLNVPENNEYMRQPHAVVEKALGIY